MARQSTDATGPAGGLRAGPRTLRSWHWRPGAEWISAPVRCRHDEWYLARARLGGAAPLPRAALVVEFLRGTHSLGRRVLRLNAPGRAGHELLGWLQTPPRTTHLRLRLPDAPRGPRIAELMLHNVAERDPKCNPLAAVPRWSACRPAFPIRHVVLPASIAELGGALEGLDQRILARPASFDELRRRARGGACILDPGWAAGLTLAEVERIAAESWLLMDLETTARLLAAAGAGDVAVRAEVARHGLMSARVEYADVPTRGFALQDVVPYGTRDARGGFALRVLRAGRSWQRYADRVGWATLLSSETPWADRHGDVLSAVRPVGRGEWLATDLPWLVAGRFGPLVAPAVARHLLRMHLALPLGDEVQYWTRWEDGDVVVRDMADLALRHPPLRTVRWAGDELATDAAARSRLSRAMTGPCHPRVVPLARLGLALAPRGAATRHTLIRTGRIDGLDVHDGLPAEPMAIFMKWLAREAREQSAWARQHLADQIVTWQFDTADGLRYAAQYDSAAWLPDVPTRSVHVRIATAGWADADSGRSQEEAAPRRQPSLRDAREFEMVLPDDEGLHGDRSLEFQAELARRLLRAGLMLV